MSSDEVKNQVREALANAANIGLKDEAGEDAFVRGTIHIVLGQIPRDPDDPNDGPGVQDARLMIWQTGPGLPLETLMTMLQETATKFKMEAQ